MHTSPSRQHNHAGQRGDDPEEPGLLLRALRKESRLTLQQLAERLDCSKAQLSLMESGQRRLSIDWAQRLESELDVNDQRLVHAVQLHQLQPQMRHQVARNEQVVGHLKDVLSADDPVAALRQLLEDEQIAAPNIDAPLSLGRIPVINKVAAGYPTEFTDLDYPASIADEYVACPDVNDPNAFGARVVGDSMAPEYHEGEIVIFSPQLPTPEGSDCFVRLEAGNETTFKRVYFEDNGNHVRLEPINSAYQPRTVAAERIAGIYAAAYVMRRV